MSDDQKDASNRDRLHVLRIEKRSGSRHKQIQGATPQLAILRKQAIDRKMSVISKICNEIEVETTASGKERLDFLDQEIVVLRNTMRAEVDQLIRTAHAHGQDLSQIAQAESCALILNICKNFVGSTYQMDATALPSIIADEVSKFPSKSRVTVTVHPEDINGLTSCDSIGSHVFIETNDTYERGDYTVESPSGKIDGRLSLKFDQLKSSLTAAFHDHTPSMPEAISARDDTA